MQRTKTPRPALAGLMILAALLSFAACAAPGASIGEPAPEFRLQGSDGQTHTLDSLTRRGPVFFYAIKHDCPINEQAHPHFVALSEAYGSGATFVGVINRDEAGYRAWQEKYRAPYTVLFDPERVVIGGLRMERSPWLVEVDRHGRIARTWRGYSAPDLEEMNESMASAARRSTAELDFAGAPESTRYG